MISCFSTPPPNFFLGKERLPWISGRNFICKIVKIVCSFEFLQDAVKLFSFLFRQSVTKHWTNCIKLISKKKKKKRIILELCCYFFIILEVLPIAITNYDHKVLSLIKNFLQKIFSKYEIGSLFVSQ